MKTIFTEKRITLVLLLLLFFILPAGNFAQEEKPAEAATPATEVPVENPPTTESAQPVEQKAEAAPGTQAAKIVIYPGVQKIVNEQFRWTPEDPSFLYETRNIPDHQNTEEFLPAELEKVIVKERIKEEHNFRKSLEKIKIRLPDLTQTLILVSIIIILLVYRSRAKRSQDHRR